MSKQPKKLSRLGAGAVRIPTNNDICTQCFCERLIKYLEPELVDKKEELKLVREALSDPKPSEAQFTNEDIEQLKSEVASLEGLLRDAKHISKRMLGGTHWRTCPKA